MPECAVKRVSEKHRKTVHALKRKRRRPNIMLHGKSMEVCAPERASEKHRKCALTGKRFKNSTAHPPTESIEAPSLRRTVRRTKLVSSKQAARDR